VTFPPGGRGHRRHERCLRDVGGRHPPDQRPDSIRCPRRTRAAAGRQRDVTTLVTENLHATVELDTEQFAEVFDDVGEPVRPDADRVQKVGRQAAPAAPTTTVTYTGDNNVTYSKTCRPNRSDISVQSIEPVYLPEVRQTTELQKYTYPTRYYAAGPSRVTDGDGIHRCVHCDTSGVDGTYTYCPNCGAIACNSHTKTERLEGEPVCTGCAVTERFALKMKYFYDEGQPRGVPRGNTPQCHSTRRRWRTSYSLEGVVATLLLVVGLLVIGGII